MSVIVAIAQINSTVGDLAGNSERIAAAARRAADQGVDILLTPELSLVGYPPEDLLLRRSFYAKSAAALAALAAELAGLKGLHVIVGHPLTEAEGDGNGAGDFVNYNAASVLKEGEIIATYRKHALPNYTVFDEKRYFTPSDDACTFDVKGTRFAINICEDTWFPDMPAKARAAGAEHIIDYTQEDVGARCREITGGAGVPVVFDGVGQSTWEGSRKSCAARGLIISFGNASGPVTDVALAQLADAGSIFVTRPTLFHYYAHPAERAAGAARLFDMIRSGTVHVDIRQRYALTDAARAHRELEARQTSGCSLLIP